MKHLADLFYPAAAAVFSITAPFARAQGSLTPPGPPGPTMKTLAQIEPRTPIGSLPFVIVNAGAYYLTDNLTGAAEQNGITVLADNVTLDLSGFALSGTSGTQTGVTISGARKNFALRNGTITGWTIGVDAAAASNGQFEGLRFADNRGDGLRGGTDASLRDCSAQANSGDGIVVASGGILKDCAARQNAANGITAGSNVVIENGVALSNFGVGLDAGEGATIKSSTARSNKTGGIRAAGGSKISDCTSSFNTRFGFSVGAATQISGCSAVNNDESGVVAAADCHISNSSVANNKLNGIIGQGNTTLLQCTASSNEQAGFSAGASALVFNSKAHNNGTGIQVGDGSTVRGCSVQSSKVNGIVVSSECSVVDNHCQDNFNARDTAGIQVTGGDNSIKENTLISNDRGIAAAGPGNLVMRNAAANNTINYFFSSAFAQFAGPIVNDTNAAPFTVPWANFQY